jgi:putative endopeptidase
MKGLSGRALAALLGAGSIIALSSGFAATAADTSRMSTGQAAAAPEPSDTQAPHYGTWGYDPDARDLSVKPGDDFFLYANGNALKTMEIPADRTRYGNFDALTVLSENRVHAILEGAAANPGAPGSRMAKIGAYYHAFMDEARIEAVGDAPLQKDLDAVRAATSHEDIVSLMGDTHGGFYASIFGGGVGPDAKDPDHYAFQMGSGGLGLPDRDYYLKPSFADTKTKYEAYVAQMLTLAKWPDPEGSAKAIVAFETQLATASWDRVQRRDRDKTYNPMTPAELAAYAPGFDWNRYFAALEVPGLTRVVIGDNTAFPAKAKIFAETPVDTLKAWEAFHVVDDAAPYLTKPFVDARFEFRNKTLAGQPELGPRWKRAVAATNGALGEAVGEVYVERYFTPEAKAQMLALVGNIKTALGHRIENLEWMSPETKKQALVKLSKFTVKIAYPDKWRDYSGLEVKSGDLYGDIKRSREFEWTYRLARFHKPVDRTEWGMTPQTVNAYYNPTMNEIVFPAAILQPPFFDPHADPAINYGGIGGVIGHEISHGFDDQGRKSDGTGRLADWWTAEDATKFKARTDRLGAQYSANSPLPGEHIQGGLTMGENIGDMGGINLALDAYHASLHGQPAPVIDGLTGDQRVFLGWAQVWRQKIRDSALVQQLHTDPHSPATARVNEVVRNVDAWYAAFDVKPGDKLYLAPADRVHIW